MVMMPHYEHDKEVEKSRDIKQEEEKMDKEPMQEQIKRDVFTKMLGGYGLSDEQIDKLEGEIIALIKEAGYGRLSDDQTPPENPFRNTSGLNDSAHNGFELAKMKYRGWRKVELEVKDE